MPSGKSSSRKTNMKYRIRHTTRYQYALPVSHCYNLAYVLPRTTDRQRVDTIDIKLSPPATTSTNRSDYFGNQFLQFSIEKAHSELDVSITSEITIKDSSTSINLDFGNPCSYVKYLLQHGKDWETQKFRIKSNQEFWHKKIGRNIERDQEVNQYLINNGWKVLRFWSKEVKKNLQECIDTIISFIDK